MKGSIDTPMQPGRFKSSKDGREWTDRKEWKKRSMVRCRYHCHSDDGDICTLNSPWSVESKCQGVPECGWYEALTDEELKKKQKAIRETKKQEAKSKGMASASAGTDSETPSESPKRRYKGRCRFYSYDGERCRCKSSPCYKSKCKGSGGCREYRAVTEGVFRNRQKKQAEAKKTSRKAKLRD